MVNADMMAGGAKKEEKKKYIYIYIYIHIYIWRPTTISTIAFIFEANNNNIVNRVQNIISEIIMASRRFQ